MPSLKIEATEMKDASVSHISLVERGANRMPFKVIKQEKSMSKALDLDLSRVFSRKAEAPKPQVVALVTMKDDGTFEVVKAAFETAGFSVAKSEDQKDNSVVFAQVDELGDAKDHTVVRLSDTCALVVKAFRPYNMDFDIGEEGVSFADVCKAQGFYPGLGTMVDVLRSSVLTMAENSDDPTSAAKAVKKMFTEAADYAVSLVSALPAKAFKLERLEVAKADAAVVQGAGKTTTDAPKEDGSDLEVMKAEDSLPESVEKADLKKVPVGVEPKVWAGMDDAAKTKWWADKLKSMPAKKEETTAAPVVAGVTAEQVGDIVAKAMQSLTDSLATKFDGVTKSVKEVTDGMTTIEGRVATSEKAVQKAVAALTGTTVLGSEVGDQANIQKTEQRRSSSVEVDTAYSVRRRPGAR